MYKIGNEWCMTLDVKKTTPVTEPQVQLNIGAEFKFVPPPGGEMSGHLDARDPVTGKVKWQVSFRATAAGERAGHRRQPGVPA